MQVERKPAKRALPKLKDMKPGTVFVHMDAMKDKAAYMVLEYETLDQGYAGRRPCVDLDKGKRVLFDDHTFVILCSAKLILEVPVG
jgi:hypothetical protein